MSSDIAIARAISVALLLVAGRPALAAPPIGAVTRMEGTASAKLVEKTVTLSAGSDVFAGEAIATDAAARLEITLADKTMLTLGENARLTLDDFVFDPDATTRINLSVNGAFRYVSGKLGVGATRVAEVTTPAATLGARGTDFWGGPIDGHFGVVVLEGTVTVTHLGATVVLRHRNDGTDLATGNNRPGPVHPWAQPKIDRAIATVTFR